VREPSLQPFDKRNFERDAVVADRPWSFDAIHSGRRPRRLARGRTRAPFLHGPLDPFVPSPLGLDQLERFLRHP